MRNNYICHEIIMVTIIGDSMSSDSIKSESMKSYGINPRPSPRRSEVLLYIVERGPTNTYRISEGLGIRYSTAHNAVKALEKQGFIRLELEEETEKGVTAKIYTPTLGGLCAALTLGNLWSRVDDVAEKWGNLDPLLLGKWKYMVSVASREEAIEALKIAAKTIYEKPIIDKDGRRVMDGFPVLHFFRTEFFDRLFHPTLRSDVEKWIEAVQGDPELKDWVTKWLRRRIPTIVSWFYYHRELLRGIEGKGFTGWKEFDGKKVASVLEAMLPKGEG